MDIPDTEIGYENFREENASDLSDREHGRVAGWHTTTIFSI
jgi:hypothetical protein